MSGIRETPDWKTRKRLQSSKGRKLQSKKRDGKESNGESISVHYRGPCRDRVCQSRNYSEGTGRASFWRKVVRMRIRRNGATKNKIKKVLKIVPAPG